MNVLIACEESQVECCAFREVGCNAFSCDIKEQSGGHPEWHIQGDCLSVINGRTNFTTSDGKQHTILDGWDLIIAHPPCTYLTYASAGRLFDGNIQYIKGQGCYQKVNITRLKQGLLARDFFLQLYNADCDKICVENPLPLKLFMLPKHTQIIHPYFFGEPYSKKTMLWLKNLPLLEPTNILQSHVSYTALTRDPTVRSKSFKGIAQAMAQQWSK